MAFITKEEFKKLVSYYNLYIQKYNFYFTLLLIISLLSKVIVLISPFLMGKILDYVITKEFGEIVKILFITFGLFILNSSISLAETYIRNLITNKLILDVKKQIFTQCLHLNILSYDKKTVGEYISGLEGDTGIIVNFYMNNILSICLNFITVIISGIFIFKISITMSVVGVLSFPLSCLINYVFGKKMRKLQEKIRAISDKYMMIIQQSFLGIREIKGMNIEKVILGNYEKNLNNMFKVNMKSGITSSIGGLLQMTASTFLQTVLTALGCYYMIIGKITVGAYVAFSSYMGYFLEALYGLTSINLSVQTTLVSINRLDEIIILDNIENLTAPQKFLKLEGNIKVENISFSYKTDNETGNCVLNNMSIDFNANELTAIVGSSGCGKTTFFNLLMRFFEYTSGNIYMDNYRLNDIDLFSLRQNITYIQQEPFLFNDTIKNNLILANENATDAAIADACKKAYIYDFIKNLPNGFDTMIGEGASNFSGGQRQRLAIARGILRDSKIFLMDEITSDLDGESESYLVKVINELSESHTVIIVAHRITTVVNINRIIVFDDGRVVSQGNHKQLLNTCPNYQKLFKKQSF